MLSNVWETISCREEPANTHQKIEKRIETRTEYISSKWYEVLVAYY